MHSARKHLKKELLEMTEQELHRPTPDTAFAGRVQEQIEAMTSLHAALAEPIRQSLVETLGDDTSVRVVAVENTIGLHVLRDFPYPCCTSGRGTHDPRGETGVPSRVGGDAVGTRR